MWFQTNKPEYKAKAIAYYRHSAQDRQENSIPIQREQIKKFADIHGIEIIDHFSDYGKSGLSTEKREGFNSLIDKVVNDKDRATEFSQELSRKVFNGGVSHCI